MSDDPTRIIRRPRDPDEDPERTRIVRHGDEEPDPHSEIVSRPASRQEESDPTRLYGGSSDEDEPTRLMGEPAQPSDERTVLHRRRKPSPPTDDSAESDAAPSETESGVPAEEPAVGWLVVVEGPGKGKSLTLSYGMNSIGRSEENRVPLSFGDEEVSRTKHAILSYDPKGRKFYVQSGGDSINLTYLDEAPLLTPQPIQGGERIRLGQTVLQFVPFCGEHFDWD